MKVRMQDWHYVFIKHGYASYVSKKKDKLWYDDIDVVVQLTGT